MRVSGIEVKYIYSACVVISTPNARVLTDPWFTEGAYDGSWFHFPKLEDPLTTIGEVDYIYVSHVHPDHYDPKFIKNYFARYGEKPIIIAAHSPNHLENKMRIDGLKASVLSEPLYLGTTTLEITPHKTGSASDIDSALVVRFNDGRREHVVLNANDIIFDDEILEALKRAAPVPDILLCGYTGAGPYPQTYFEVSDQRLLVEAEKKKLAFFERYKKVTAHFGAHVNIPFAGKYVLGGKLSRLNDYRGVADAVEVTVFDHKAVILADNGGTINTCDFNPSAVRKEPYPAHLLKTRLAEISESRMDYERLIPSEEIHQLPLNRLLAIAARKANLRSECKENYYFVFDLPRGGRAVINACKGVEQVIRFIDRTEELPVPRSEILIDYRYLFGLLTHVYHWNNAEVGSQYLTLRVPNELNRSAQAFLNFLAV